MSTTSIGRVAESHNRVQTWPEGSDSRWVTRCRCGWIGAERDVRGDSIEEWDAHVEQHHAGACKGDSSVIGIVCDGERHRRIMRVCDGRNIGVHAEAKHSTGRVVTEIRPHGTPTPQLCADVEALIQARSR